MIRLENVSKYYPTRFGRNYVLRIPLEGGGRIVVELNAAEVQSLSDVLAETASTLPKK